MHGGRGAVGHVKGRKRECVLKTAFSVAELWFRNDGCDCAGQRVVMLMRGVAIVAVLVERSNSP